MNKNKKPRMTKKDMETAKRLLKYVTEKYKLQFILVFFDKLQHPVGIGFRVVSQSPADGLIDEKLGLIKIINQDLLQQLDIRFFFLKQLVFNGKAPQPKIFIPAPLQHKFLCLRIVQANKAY